jgi:DNA invertase Pin-like site-specific DNA recombinase
LTLQHQALRGAGCTKIYSEKMSGARGDRPQLARMFKALEPGDVVIVTRLDRLARSTRDLLGLLDAIRERGAKFKSIAEPIIDTSDTAMGQFVVTLLGAIGQFERSLIMARTQDGIRRAREQGVAFGRPGRLNPRQKKMIA